MKVVVTGKQKKAEQIKEGSLCKSTATSNIYLVVDDSIGAQKVLCMLLKGDVPSPAGTIAPIERGNLYLFDGEVTISNS